DFIRKTIRNIPDFDKIIKHLLFGIFTGVSFAEIIWKRTEEGIIIPEKIVPSPMGHWRIALLGTDEHGQPDPEQIDAPSGVWSYVYVDPITSKSVAYLADSTLSNKFICHVPSDRPIFDRGIFRSVVWSYFLKQIGITYWS